jgi:prevent-host-death family protein
LWAGQAMFRPKITGKPSSKLFASNKNVDNTSVNKYIDTNMNNTISISQLRQDATNIIDKIVASQQPTVILQRSKPKAVLVDYDYFQAMEQSILDASDNAEAEKAKKEPTIKFDDYLKKRFGESL